MNLFYVPDIDKKTVALPKDEAKHCIHVLRYQQGHSLSLTDGKGYFYNAIIENIFKNEVLVRIRSKQEQNAERTYKLHVAVAPTKSIDRFEWFLEKATEIGIDEITPLITHHSERKKLRTERLEKVIIAAMKQSLKSYKPILHDPLTLSEFLGGNFADSQLFIAYCGEVEKKILKSVYKKGGNAVVLIGPEGDFAESEVREAIKEGFTPVSLGDVRLRTETAGVVVCHSLFLFNQL
jgi:16S rRNA (uracil1498-N3)-methyltransferase